MLFFVQTMSCDWETTDSICIAVWIRTGHLFQTPWVLEVIYFVYTCYQIFCKWWEFYPFIIKAMHITGCRGKDWQKGTEAQGTLHSLLLAILSLIVHSHLTIFTMHYYWSLKFHLLRHMELHRHQLIKDLGNRRPQIFSFMISAWILLRWYKWLSTIVL